MVKDADTAVGARRAREQFLAAGALSADAVAPGVLNSWRRSRELHVHPDRVELPYLRDPDTDTPLTHAAAPVLRRIAEDLSEQAVSVVLTSADGLVLDRIAPDSKIERMLDDVRLARGYSYAEEFAGTNGIGTALETGKPTFIQGSEHYVGTLGRLACAGSPIREPVTRRILGVIDLTCWAKQADPLLFVLAKSACSQIEDRIRAMNNETETALLDAYLKQSRRYPAGVLAIGGDVVLMNPY
ncbi:MAG TPA: GAF domain-containing protein, partial [Mycobacterium sp.]|nr:GAF domain-containing protein [Mycobacterium sp.]